jgi:hypothetical protein
VHGAEVDVEANLNQRQASASRFPIPVDLVLTSHYAAGHTIAYLLASTLQRRQILSAEVHVEGDLPDLIAHPRNTRWRASGRARLASFPLDDVGFLEDQQARGSLTCELAIQGYETLATLPGRINGDVRLAYE